ncbi:MAG: hypothetical protein CL678_08535 [Bdellovibrionaceae bacterium]|nr:hypothetical protein [Pseudobdellovibrionaceae bacterium]|tara:strand:+ start:195 stop:377 length:183 start_codon:yes stop_codon:yes gene_type:complete
MGVVRAGGCDLEHRNAIQKYVREGYTAEQIYEKLMVQLPVIEHYVRFYKGEPKKAAKKKE